MCEPEIREHGDVSAQRRGVAAHEDQAGGTGRGESRRRLAAEAWARGIGDDDAGGHRVPSRDLGPVDAHSGAEVVSRVPDGRSVPLDSNDLAIVTEQAGEDADPAVRVDERALLVVVDERVADRGEDRLGTIGTGLEERGRRDREPTAPDRLVEARSAAASSPRSAR